MADVLTGKAWVLDTVAGYVTSGPVKINHIQFTFTTAAAGSFKLSMGSESVSISTANTILNYNTTAASTAAVTDLTRIIYFNGTVVDGLRKQLCVQLTPPIIVVTE